MWVWSRGEPADLVSFARSQGVTRLYVYVDRPHGAERARLERLAELASSAGVALWALSGDPRWALRPSEALAWQHEALATGLFVGTHLDVEPYTLPEWDRDRAHVVSAFISLLEQVHRASDLPLQIDVPFWYGDIQLSGGATLADAVLDVGDAVTVMSYRDTATGPDSLAVVAADMLARAEHAGVPIELAVETNRVEDCHRCTFYEEGVEAMHAVIAAVSDAVSDHPTFTGFAVHDFDGLTALVDRRARW